MATVLGIDGGGTRTRAVMVNDRGDVRGAGEAGGANAAHLGEEQVRRNLSEAVFTAKRTAGDVTIDAVFAGLAGVSRENERAAMHAVVADVAGICAERVEVDHDMRIAHAGALGGEPGIVVIAGTGSACFGVSPDGATHRVGGFGSLFDDAGSAFWLGREAAIVAIREADGRAPASTLGEMVRSVLGDDLRVGVLPLSATGEGRVRVASLAPLVFDAIAASDITAAAIVVDAIAELTRCVAAVRAALDFGDSDAPVAVVGGLTAQRAAFLEPLADMIRSSVAGVRVVEPVLPPVLGAALLALRRVGVAVEALLIKRLRSAAAE